MIDQTKIICTIGPSSFKEDILLKLKDKGTDFFRINLSHTPLNEIESKITELEKYGVPIMIDTEGPQIRVGNIEETVLSEEDKIKIFDNEEDYVNGSIFFNIKGVIENLSEGDLIFLDFHSVLVKVSNTLTLDKGYIEGVILIGGLIEKNKAVYIDSEFKFPFLSDKDIYAIGLAKKHGIKNFSLSFVKNKEDIYNFKKIYPGAYFLAKIETKESIHNLNEILDSSPAILIDRNDLGRNISLSVIPFAQKHIIKKAKEKNKEVFIATHILENMSFELKPMKSEVNDIFAILNEKVDGFVLTKETAVGKYPVETINMLSSLIKEVSKDRLKIDLEDVTYGLLPEPHGGKLINRIVKGDLLQNKIKSMKKIIVGVEDIMDVEQIAIGSFSPLEGFMKKSVLISVLDNMRLDNGVIWTLPIILQVKNIGDIKEGEEILLINEEDNEAYAILYLEEIYQVDKEIIAKKWFGTSSLEHPGVRKFFEKGNYILGGKIDLIKRRKSINKVYELSPKQIRQIFSERGWNKVVGFHTRNVIHCSHEFIQMEAYKKENCDGLFIQPIVGKKKRGDFESPIIIKTYEKMMKEFYPKGKVFFSVLATYSRYSGPREALFTALVRKNFGCSHFIVGRDHTGVANFYSMDASHKIFDKFSKEELGITPIKFGEVFYSPDENKYFHESDCLDYSNKKKIQISGTQAREMFLNDIRPPTWFMRPEISQIILNKIKKGEKVFVE